jgi:hypothetical protein
MTIKNPDYMGFWQVDKQKDPFFINLQYKGSEVGQAEDRLGTSLINEFVIRSDEISFKKIYLKGKGSFFYEGFKPKEFSFFEGNIFKKRGGHKVHTGLFALEPYIDTPTLKVIYRNIFDNNVGRALYNNQQP